MVVLARPGAADAVDRHPLADDCFHPTVRGQNRMACVAFSDHPLNASPRTEDCGSVRQCGNGVLESAWGEQCEEHAHCGAGQVCNGFCLCVPAVGGACESAADCPPGEQCRHQVCDAGG